MKSLFASATALAFLGLTTLAHASPVPLLSGQTVDPVDYEMAGVSATDPDWSGTLLGSYTGTANRTAAGFNGFEVVDGLYNVDAIVEADVIRATNGQLVFRYVFDGADNVGFSEFGTPNGVTQFDLTGFGGFGVTLAWDNTGLNGFPYFPNISRSADGDTVSVGFLDPRDPLGGFLEPLLLRVEAPLFSERGGGTASIALDSFGVSAETLIGALPAPAPIPLPAGAVLLLGAMGALSVLRRRAA